MEALVPNKGKHLTVAAGGAVFARLPVRTHVVTNRDTIVDVVLRYAKPHLREGDLLFVSERIVAISQGRAFPIKDIHPSRLARFLVRFVHKSPYGIGLGSPWTMELAIREAGTPRMLIGALCAALTKPFGLRGVFYRVVGKHVNAIDGPCSYTLPPYNEYAKLGPKDPDRVAEELKRKVGNEVVIVDANDLGVTVLGRSSAGITDVFAEEVFRDNPLGQASEQTPLCIVRPEGWR